MLRSLFLLNFEGQREHSKGFSALWTFIMCCLPSVLFVKVISQTGHLKDFVSLWTIAMCLFKLRFWLNLTLHSGHSNFWSISNLLLSQGIIKYAQLSLIFCSIFFYYFSLRKMIKIRYFYMTTGQLVFIGGAVFIWHFY